VRSRAHRTSRPRQGQASCSAQSSRTKTNVRFTRATAPRKTTMVVLSRLIWYMTLLKHPTVSFLEARRMMATKATNIDGSTSTREAAQSAVPKATVRKNPHVAMKRPTKVSQAVMWHAIAAGSVAGSATAAGAAAVAVAAGVDVAAGAAAVAVAAATGVATGVLALSVIPGKATYPPSWRMVAT